jgi:hypothetical protein
VPAPPQPLVSNQRFTIRLTRSGRHWHAHIAQGVMRLGESGSSTYRSRHQHRTVRKAMRTVSRCIADQHLDDVTVRIEHP